MQPLAKAPIGRGAFKKIHQWYFRAPHAEKRPKTRLKKSKGKTTGFFFPLNFFGQKFLTWIPPQKVFVVFLNCPC
jgi:hypothetical protein